MGWYNRISVAFNLSDSSFYNLAYGLQPFRSVEVNFVK